MYDEQTLLKVIAKLMAQVEEERRLREEAIRALTRIPFRVPYKPNQITDEDVKRRILELI